MSKSKNHQRNDAPDPVVQKSNEVAKRVPPEQPSSEQTEAVELLSQATQNLGVELATTAPPPPELSLAQLIERAWNAQRSFQAAQRKAEEASKAADHAKSDALETKKRMERQEAQWRKKLDELDERERQLLVKEATLAERERNAEAGFLAERRRILAELDAEVSTLRKELETLQATLDTRRSAEEEAWRKRLSERAERWRAEEEERTRAFEQKRRELDKELAQERERQLATTRAEATQVRQATEQEQTRQWKARSAGLDSREKELESLQMKLAQEGKELRRQRSDLQAQRELLEEDRRAFEVKVERFAAVKVAALEADLKALQGRFDHAATLRDQYWKALESRHELDRRFGEAPERVLERLEQLEQENTRLHSELRASLGKESARRLAELEKERSTWLDEEAVLRAKLAEAEARLGRQRAAAVQLETLRTEKEALETNKKLLEEAIKELGSQVEKYTQADEKRNPMEALLELDRNTMLQQEVRTSKPLGFAIPTLKEFVVDLRHRIANAIPERTLYYSERDVRCFLGGLAMSRLMLLQGISGTGKTSLPLAFAGATGAGHEVVEVQAGWRDRQDLIGYFNAFHRHYYATNFLQALYRAGTPTHRNRLFILILDEINLSRVEQFFADFLSALEQPEERRRLTLLNDPVQHAPALMQEGRHLPIPPNIWFIGTANHDETTTEFADKTYDRAHVMELPRRDLQRDLFTIKEKPSRDALSYEELMKTFSEAGSKQATEVSKVLKWLRDKEGLSALLDKRFRIGWGNRLERDAERYVPVICEAGGTTAEALDHLLCTKVLRKLKDRHDVRPKALEELEVELKKSWSGFGGDPDRSLALIERELRNKRDEEGA